MALQNALAVYSIKKREWVAKLAGVIGRQAKLYEYRGELERRTCRTEAHVAAWFSYKKLCNDYDVECAKPNALVEELKVVTLFLRHLILEKHGHLATDEDEMEGGADGEETLAIWNQESDGGQSTRITKTNTSPIEKALKRALKLAQTYLTSMKQHFFEILRLLKTLPRDCDVINLVESYIDATLHLKAAKVRMKALVIVHRVLTMEASAAPGVEQGH